MAALNCFSLTYFGTDPAGLGSVHNILRSMVGPRSWRVFHALSRIAKSRPDKGYDEISTRAAQKGSTSVQRLPPFRQIQKSVNNINNKNQMHHVVNIMTAVQLIFFI